MQRNSVEIFAEIALLEKYNPYGSRDTGLWFSEHDWDNEIIPCINEMKQKYNIPFDEIPEPEEPVMDELVENKIIFFENPNELKKIDLDFHKIEIKHPTELQIKMSKSVKALRELVSYKDQFDPQDWKDYLYDEAVVLQQKTKSKKTIEFLPEIWGLIKDFLLPSAEEIEAIRTKTKVLRNLKRYNQIIEPLVIEIFKFGKPCLERIGTRIAIFGNSRDVIRLINQQNLTEYVEIIEEFNKGRTICTMTEVRLKPIKHIYLANR